MQFVQVCVGVVREGWTLPQILDVAVSKFPQKGIFGALAKREDRTGNKLVQIANSESSQPESVA